MDDFVAKRYILDGTPGYMVSQLVDGRKICGQFVCESDYKDFCEWINRKPKIIE
jgi:hypothetical protein